MKTFGILALGGAMGLKFEDLSYDNLRASFSKVRYNFIDSRTKNSTIFRPFQRFMETKTSILPSLVMTTFHTSNGAMLTEMELLHFLNLLDVDQNQDSGTQLK